MDKKNITQLERENLEIIRKTADSYRSKVDFILNSKFSISELDKKIVVDDSMAINAFRRLEKHRVELKNKAALSFENDVELTAYQFYGSIVFLLISFLALIIYTKKTILISASKLEESLNFQQAIQNSSNYALIATNINGVITNFNQAAEAQLGYKAQELLYKETPAIFHDFDEVVERSKTFSDFIGQTIPPGFETFVCLTDRGLPNDNEWTYIRKDGTKFAVQLSITALKDDDGQVTGYLGIANDITERKKYEKEIMSAREAAEKALSIKSDFLANMSHELRTPMNGIIGMSKLLLEDLKDSENIEKLKIIDQSASSLLNILNNILEISKIDAGKIEIEEINFNLNELLKNILEIQKASKNADDRRKIKFTLDYDQNIPGYIQGDEFRLKQIFNNLLNNAIKFTDSGEVKLSAKLQTKYNSIVEINFAVTDTGVGLKKESISKLFDNFTQADMSTTRKYGGTGLGLPIVKSLINAMDSEIKVESEFGKGSSFSFTLPFPIGYEEKKEKEEVMAYEDYNYLRVLVAEDNLINQKVTKSILAKFKIDPVIVENGKLAFEKACIESFDIIFMDCHMPVMDGHESTKNIQLELKENSPYIVALTASAMEEDIKKCHDSGMNEVISKPCRINDFQLLFQKFNKKAA